MISAQDFESTTIVLDIVCSYGLLYLCFLFVRYGLNYYFTPQRWGYFILAIQSLMLAIIWLYACEWLMNHLPIDEPAYAVFWEQTWSARILLGWVLIYDFCLLNLILRINQKTQKELKLHQNTEKLRKEAELFMLRQQLQPHFLFNSLNSINALIGKEPQLARTMVQQLSEYLRHTLKKEDEAHISFREEMKDLQIYLNIEQIRFGHRLKVIEDIEEICLDYKIPPFLLQPLVENAIKYGLYGTLGEVTIHLSAYCQDRSFFFKITNPYDPLTGSVKGTGFGLESVKRRLYLLYSRNDLLELHREQIQDEQQNETQHYYTAIIQIPVAKNSLPSPLKLKSDDPTENHPD